MQIGLQRQTSHSIHNNQRGRRDPPTHRQDQYYPDQGRQHSHSHLQPTYKQEQAHQFLTYTRKQPYRTQHPAYNTTQCYQTPTQNQF